MAQSGQNCAKLCIDLSLMLGGVCVWRGCRASSLRMYHSFCALQWRLTPGDAIPAMAWRHGIGVDPIELDTMQQV